MIIEAPYETHKSSDGKWFVEVRGRYFQVTDNVINLLNCLNNSDSYESAYERYCQDSELKLSYQDFCLLSENQINKLGFLKEEKINQNSYLTVRFKAVSPKLALYIGRLFSPFFNKIAFSVLLTSAFAFQLLIGMPALIEYGITGFNITASLLILLSSALLHEFGHVAACTKFGVKSKGIGFGFYFFIPVAYSDISGIWMLNKSRRQIVNFAGVYMEMLYSLVVGAIAVMKNDSILLSFSCFLFLFSIRSLNPFVRNDGYWILSDLTNTPNLMNASMVELKKTVNALVNKPTQYRMTRKSLALSFYPVINILVITCLLLYLYNNKSSEIIDFPENLISFIIDAFSGQFNRYFLTWDNLLAFGFYAFIIRLFFIFRKFISRYLQTPKKLTNE